MRAARHGTAQRARPELRGRTPTGRGDHGPPLGAARVCHDRPAHQHAIAIDFVDEDGVGRGLGRLHLRQKQIGAGERFADAAAQGGGFLEDRGEFGIAGFASDGAIVIAERRARLAMAATLVAAPIGGDRIVGIFSNIIV